LAVVAFSPALFARAHDLARMLQMRRFTLLLCFIGAFESIHVRRDLIYFALASVGYFILLFGWLVLSNWFLTPIIDGLSLDEKTRFSDTLIQISGVLIGFSGLCAFFFIEKAAEISDKAYRESVECSREYSKSVIMFETVNSTLLFLSPRLKGVGKKAVESIVTEVEENLKEMKTVDKSLAEQVDDVERIPRSANRLAVLEILSIAFFLIAFVLGLISKLTYRAGFLDDSLSIVVIGAMYMVYISIAHLSFVGDANGVMRKLISLRSKISVTQVRAIEIKGRLKDRNLIKYLDNMSTE
jgi:hypothetical protein